MTSPFNSFITNTFSPPVMEARNWLENTKLPDNLELMNLSQAAPVDPPPIEIRKAIADASLNKPEAHLYGPVLGNDDLNFDKLKSKNVDYLVINNILNNEFGSDENKISIINRDELIYKSGTLSKDEIAQAILIALDY